MAFIILVVGTCILLGVGNIIYLFLNTEKYSRGEPCITFDQFISFYNIAPEDRFVLEKGYIKMVYPSYSGLYSNCELYYFKTNLDELKYNRFRERLDKDKRHEEQLKTRNKALMKLAETMNNDIDEVTYRNKLIIENSINNIKKIEMELKNNDY